MSLRWRRGSIQQAAPPPPGSAFGPTNGAQSVRDGAGARPVSNPGGGISFNSSTSLQSAINNNPIGSTFVCSSNAPVWNSSVNTTTRRPTIIFPGAVGQCVINSGSAFQAGDGCVVKGGTWDFTGTTGSGFILQDDCVIEDVVVRNAFTNGIAFQGHRSRVSHARTTSNGAKGIGTGNSGLGQTDDIIVEYVEIDLNNTRLLDGGFDASGSKFLYVGRGHFHHNWAHHNSGFGLWWDTENFACLIEENVCEDNGFSGLMYEGNYGSTIRRNYIANNGRNVGIGGQPATIQNTVNVRFSDSPSDRAAPDGVVYPADFSFNLVDHTGSFGGQTGRLILLWDHTDSIARHVGNHQIHHNQFWCRSLTTNLIRAIDQDTVGLPATTNYQIWNLNNNYFNNQYRVASLGVNYWSWDTGTGIGVEKTFVQWQGFHPTGETRQLI